MKSFFIATFLLFSVSIFAQTTLDTALNFSVKDTYGNNIILYDLLDEGKIVVVDFFSVAWGTCQAYAPDLQAAYESFGCNQGNVFFLGIDKGNTNAAVLQFDSIYNVHYPSASGNQGNGNIVHWDYNIQATPSVVVINPDKSIAVKQIFPPTTENLIDSVSMAGGIQQACLTLVEESGTNEISLFPNPVHDYLVVTAYQDQTIESFQIYDLTGRKIREPEIIGNTGNKIIVNTAGFTNGFYLIEIRFRSGKTEIKKFIRK